MIEAGVIRRQLEKTQGVRTTVLHACKVRIDASPRPSQAPSYCLPANCSSRDPPTIAPQFCHSALLLIASRRPTSANCSLCVLFVCLDTHVQKEEEHM